MACEQRGKVLNRGRSLGAAGVGCQQGIAWEQRS